MLTEAQPWTKSIEKFIATLPVVDFPFEHLPEIYLPERTVFRLSDDTRIHPYLWCYLERRARKGHSEFDPNSLSVARVAALPRVIERMSKRCRFGDARPRTIHADFAYMSQFLSWTDAQENEGKFEDILTDSDQAVAALKGHHTFLRHLLQSHQIAHSTAAHRDQRPINILSEIHDRTFKDEIEPHEGHGTGGTEAPQDEEAARFLSTLQEIFDSAARLVLRDGAYESARGLTGRVVLLSHTDDTQGVRLPENYSDVRLMELACVAFAGIAIGDSGANLAQIQAYEEPHDLLEQLAQPERINLTKKVIKFRAGGKDVPVHLTVMTMTRLLSYLEIRSRLIARLDSDDIPPMFVQCEYGELLDRFTPREPISVKALAKNFLNDLRRRTHAIGVELPAITFRQLRAYKQQYLTRHHGVKVSADTMGHSIATAIATYCKTQESVRQSEMGMFLSSLVSTVLNPARGASEAVPTVSIPPGSCAEYGKPKVINIEPVVRPDCKKTEGCFFCANYRLHADERDLCKLLSCRHVLRKLAPLQGESATADRVYRAVLDRVDALLGEARRRAPLVYETIEQDVQVSGNLSNYWAAKLQQLHLLGMLVLSE